MRTFFSSTRLRPVSLWSLASRPCSFAPVLSFSLSPFSSLLHTFLAFGNHQAVLGEQASTPPRLPTLMGIPSFSLILLFQIFIVPLIMSFSLIPSVSLENSMKTSGQPLFMVCPLSSEPKMTMIMTKLSERHLNPK